MMVPTTLFKTVRSSSHEQSLRTYINKPVSNQVQAGQLNYVQACQQQCSSSPAQPCSSLSTGKNKQCVFTCVCSSIVRASHWPSDGYRLCTYIDIILSSEAMQLNDFNFSMVIKRLKVVQIFKPTLPFSSIVKLSHCS